MTLQEYIKHLNRMQQEHSRVAASLEPSIQLQRKLESTLQISRQLQRRLEPTLQLSRQFQDLNQLVNPTLVYIINHHQAFLNQISNLTPDFLLREISFNTAIAIQNISLEIVDELEEYVPEQDVQDVIAFKSELNQLSEAKPLLTVDQVLMILSILLTLLSIVQGLMPDAQLTSIERKLDQIIEYQAREVGPITEE